MEKDNNTDLSDGAMRGLGRSPIAQALTNAEMALRALALAPRGPSDLCPHPLDIVRAELENVRRYLALGLAAPSASSASQIVNAQSMSHDRNNATCNGKKRRNNPLLPVPDSAHSFVQSEQRSARQK
jgi:hypothetical protein